MYASLRKILQYHPYVGTKEAVVQLQPNVPLGNSGTQPTPSTAEKSSHHFLSIHSIRVLIVTGLQILTHLKITPNIPPLAVPLLPSKFY